MPAEQPGMTFFIPCKANNAPLLVEAVQCIRWSTPEAGIVVLDDERAPCPQTVKEVLRPLSVGWKLLKETHTSSDHAVSILSLMAQSIRHPEDVLVPEEVWTLRLRTLRYLPALRFAEQ